MQNSLKLRTKNNTEKNTLTKGFNVSKIKLMWKGTETSSYMVRQRCVIKLLWEQVYKYKTGKTTWIRNVCLPSPIFFSDFDNVVLVCVFSMSFT